MNENLSNKKIRILHVVSSLSITNGIMNVIINYYRNIDRKRYQFDFLYFEDGSKTYKNEIENLGGRTYKINPPGLMNILNYRAYLKKYFLRTQIPVEFQLVHFHELALLALMAPVLRNFGAKKIIAHSHSVSYSYHPIKSLRNKLFSLKMRKNSDAFCACSKASARFWYGTDCFEKLEVNIINNAIDCEKFYFNKSVREKIRNELGITNSSIVFGHVGRFSKEKNHSFLMNVFYEYLKKQPNSILILIGDGIYFEKIQKRAIILGIKNRIIFLGQRSNIFELYQAMDIFVFPSISEGLGSAVVEAQVSGLPCVVSDTVPKEVDIFNVLFLSLHCHPSHWAHQISKIDMRRNNIKKQPIDNGFYIKYEVEKLERYYERL